MDNFSTCRCFCERLLDFCHPKHLHISHTGLLRLLRGSFFFVHVVFLHCPETFGGFHRYGVVGGQHRFLGLDLSELPLGDGDLGTLVQLIWKLVDMGH